MMMAAVGLLWLTVARGTHVARGWGALLIAVALCRWAYDIFFGGGLSS